MTFYVLFLIKRNYTPKIFGLNTFTMYFIRQPNRAGVLKVNYQFNNYTILYMLIEKLFDFQYDIANVF